MIKECIQKAADGGSLSYGEAVDAMTEIVTGKASNAQIAALLTALRMNGETIEEITAFAEVMRKNCLRIAPNTKGRLVDTCGTGGDKLKTFNVSTIAAFIIAGAGIAIAKHGNRSVTSQCGSADVLEKLGVNLRMQPAEVQSSIEQVGIGFMFAPVFHPAMKYAVEPRREMGIRTVFNVLGPLSNPSFADAQLVGVYRPELTNTIANVLKNLGCEEAMVVNGLDGLDEISTVGKTKISWLRNSEISALETVPADFGVKQTRIEDLQATTPDNNAEIVFRILNGYCKSNDPKMEMALVNAGAGILIGGKADTFSDGMERAQESIKSGAAYGKMRGLVKASGGDLSMLEEYETRYA